MSLDAYLDRECEAARRRVHELVNRSAGQHLRHLLGERPRVRRVPPTPKPEALEALAR